MNPAAAKIAHRRASAIRAAEPVQQQLTARMPVDVVMKMADDILAPPPPARTTVAMPDEGLRARRTSAAIPTC